MSRRRNTVLDHLFVEYCKYKEEVDHLEELLKIKKKELLALMDKSKVTKMENEEFELVVHNSHKTTIDESGFVKWLKEYNFNNLIDTKEIPNMELINSKYSEIIPDDVKAEFIKVTEYAKINIKHKG